MSVLSKRLAVLEASLPPPPGQFVVATYCRGDDGFDVALAEIVEEDRGKPGGITDRDEVFCISVIKGLKGRDEDLTIVRTVVDPKPEPSPQTGTRLSEPSQTVLSVMGRTTNARRGQCGSIARARAEVSWRASYRRVLTLY